MIFGIVDALGQPRSRNTWFRRPYDTIACRLPTSLALLRFKSDRHSRGSGRCTRFASPTGNSVCNARGHLDQRQDHAPDNKEVKDKSQSAQTIKHDSCRAAFAGLTADADPSSYLP